MRGGRVVSGDPAKSDVGVTEPHCNGIGELKGLEALVHADEPIAVVIPG